MRLGGRAHFSLRSGSRKGSPAADSSIAVPLILYFSLDQLPRSVRRQRSLQKGDSRSSSESTGFRQMGHNRVMRPSIPQRRGGRSKGPRFQRVRIGNRLFAGGRAGVAVAVGEANSITRPIKS